MKLNNKELMQSIDTENELASKKLTIKQELFCKYYTTMGETFGNATTSYAKAYGYDLESADTVRETETVKEGNKDVIKEIFGTSELDKMTHYVQTAGSRLLAWYDVINDRIQTLLLEQFNDDTIADKRLEQIILKGKDTDAIQAIKHRNELKSRLTRKLDITSAGRPLAGMSDEDLRAMAGEL